MINYEGINWSTEVTPNLVDRLKQKSKTLSLPVAIATEIYEVGADIERVSFEAYRNNGNISDLLRMTEASGYLRIGQEILYFQEPHGRYPTIQHFLYGSESDEITTGNWVNGLPLFSQQNTENPREHAEALEESQLTSMEVNKQIINSQIVDRKFILLREEGPYALLKDLSEEANEEYQKRNFPSPYNEFEELWKLLNPLEHAIIGMRAALQRYEQFQDFNIYPGEVDINEHSDLDASSHQTTRAFVDEIIQYIPRGIFYLTHPACRAILSSISTSTNQLSKIRERSGLNNRDVTSWIFEMISNEYVSSHIDEDTKQQRSAQIMVSLKSNLRTLMEQLNSELIIPVDVE
ncbi:MAG: hypothetical protein IH934_07950 [Nanoarchaeota archaeon]|nr:hypothetical protein [Nanoarchaeota archaeon]